jgi:DNA polymerase III alpha subunit (gram-positive type)
MYDTETGGLDPEKNSLFSLGAMVGDLDTGEIIDSFEAFHRLPSLEDYIYDDGAIEVHGITPEEAFEKGISTEELQNLFSDLWFNTGAAIIGGHNEATYDRPVVAHQLFNISVKEFEANFTYRSLDSLPVIRLYTGHDNVPSGATLTQAVKALKINMDDFGKNKFHTSLFDAVAAFRILHRFRKVFANPKFGKALVCSN